MGPFLSDEAEYFQQIAPHLIEACKCSSFLRSPLALTGSSRLAGTANIDIQGYVHFATDGFKQRLLDEWPEWRGPRVPEPIQPSALITSPSIKGASVFAVHAIANDLFLLVASNVSDGWIAHTQSEQRIALHLAHGASYKQIARQLKISPSTVTTHANNIYRKLQTKTELANLLACIVNLPEEGQCLNLPRINCMYGVFQGILQ